MGILEKIKEFGSRIIKPVIKPFNPSKMLGGDSERIRKIQESMMNQAKRMKGNPLLRNDNKGITSKIGSSGL